MRKLLVILNVGLFFAACSPNNVQVNEEIGKYFDSTGVKGTFALFDNGTGDFTIYNLNRYKDSAYSPASTFKVVHSLIALETGVVSDEKMTIQLDSAVTMETAFKNSIVPYYQEVARRIGKDTMQFWLDSLQYGNHSIGKSIDSFWLNNTIKLTPDEQLGIMKRLFFNQLPFQKRTHEIVKRMMLRESNANYQLSYKTGLTYNENGDQLGWVIGWIEENKHPYFFVLNMEAPSNISLVDARILLLKKILSNQGFFEGKR
ncbi:MAG TPA: penicillin-binding transpeptidase domain-containing protein [Sediminibacterium sp.]|uniref:penicillin-binding transpeptidase domain-containing protein n=1 Tax=Sediminibacterium sp. TaxID=1917865 RepID=UPI0008C6E446|nr:penicillin-binding transpeptidase domain-containing protein [Sediminibacterium sp.]OHC86685.1 MAG: class D beta-lactamase [Sphingobacteriia bacterium RIFOXYC2_FULL_35_18]OHC88457.1 MAG: class D beta-lactamase [Sphingobacteriia bacterium RIFOXYD2_FULL_35_12]HLD51958.1 penicillin-binding transpeptidase domain-containing protein [Sediminibacterium sp.]